jgi:hypothetical protein
MGRVRTAVYRSGSEATMLNMKRILVFVATLGVMLSLTSIALASPSVQLGHQAAPDTSGSLGKFRPPTTSKPTATPTAAGTLPFTGLDLTGFVVGGALLVGVGIVFRRAGRFQR